MTDIEPTPNETLDAVQQAMAEGTFSFAEVAQGRGYPSDTVALCKDEATAYDRAKYLDGVIEARGDTSHELMAGERREAARKQAWKRAIDEDPEVKARVEVYDAKLAVSTFVFHIQGVPEDHVEELNQKALAEIPPEYERWRNPVNGKQEKQELPSPERNRLFTNLLWAAYIQKIVDPQGRVDMAPGLPAAEAIRTMPLSQQAKFNNAINALSVSSSAFESAVDSDF